MNCSLEQASNMEEGEAGCPATQTSMSMDEKSERYLSTSGTDSSSKTLIPNSNHDGKAPYNTHLNIFLTLSGATSSLRNVWTDICTAPTRLGTWASRPQQEKVASPILPQFVRKCVIPSTIRHIIRLLTIHSGIVSSRISASCRISG
jgi:hypothetical protein